ncbi:MAG: NUDIX domain-containing protein [Candidatus Saccharibacteria bacterium]|nr:NUDIX domain-containing protein [Candidatus Saccharibacteria bacterium]
MPQPPVQIVDEQDKILGAVPIDEVYEQGLIHQIVRVMVLSSDGDILLQKRAADSRVYPGAWDNSAAGHVDEGEDYLTAAKREMSEEIGLKDVELKELGKYYTEGKQDGSIIVKRFNMVYEATASKDTKFTINQAEVSEVRWFTLNKIKQLINKNPNSVTDGLSDVIQRYYSK